MSKDFNSVYGERIVSEYPYMRYPWHSNPHDKQPTSDLEAAIRRADLRHLEVHTIDPKGSKDADDAFSLEEPDDGLSAILHVHICDPSAYVTDIKGPVFACAATNGSSFYPLGHRTRRMFGTRLRKQSSLRDGIRNVFTVSFLFFREEAEDWVLGRVLVRPAVIACNRQRAHSYENASFQFREGLPLLQRVYGLTLRLRDVLSVGGGGVLPEPIVFGKMRYLELSTPCLSAKGRVVMQRDSPHKIEVKRMVALMATSVNGVVANVVAAAAPDLSEYLRRKVGLYTHFTSPLRRFSDCMLQVELKRLFVLSGRASGLSLPEDFAPLRGRSVRGSAFDLHDLPKMLLRSREAVQRQQRLQRQSIQLRCLQYIHQRIYMDGARRVRIRFRVTSKPCERYVRMLIFMIDGHQVNVPHIARRKAKGGGAVVEEGSEHAVDIHVCRPPRNRFNDDVLPELDTLF